MGRLAARLGKNGKYVLECLLELRNQMLAMEMLLCVPSDLASDEYDLAGNNRLDSVLIADRWLLSLPGDPIAATLSAADLHDRIEQSRRLAASVQRSMYGTLSAENPGLRDRGIKEAGFVVLTESAMPGILAEVSFVSSPTDEQKLRSDGYREQIAEALYKGIARYAVGSKGVKVASAAK